MIDLARDIAVALCARFEGLRLSPYLCPAGVPTIGYGATIYLDGTRVTLHDPVITKAHAMILLREHIERNYLPGVMQLCPSIDTPERLGAITSFAYNLGLGSLRASTLRKRINAGRWDAVPAQLMRWNKAGGRVLRGLSLRRQAEAGLVGLGD